MAQTVDVLIGEAPADGRTKEQLAAEAVSGWFSGVIVFDSLGNPCAMFQRTHDAVEFLDGKIGYFGVTVK